MAVPGSNDPNRLNGPNGPAPGALPIGGGAAIVAPVSAFQGGIPQNALIVLPLSAPTTELTSQLEKGPVVVTPEQMWKLLGFNGPAVQVQDDQGRPIAIGLEDLLGGLQKHWTENQDDLMRGRIYAQELMKYERHAKAEGVLAKIVARGGDGEDWLALGLSQMNQDKLDKAEATLKGAQNIMKDNPFPSLHLARVYGKKKDRKQEREQVERAIQVDPQCVDAWAYLVNQVKEAGGEDRAIKEVEELANTPVNAKTA